MRTSRSLHIGGRSWLICIQILACMRATRWSTLVRIRLLTNHTIPHWKTHFRPHTDSRLQDGSLTPLQYGPRASDVSEDVAKATPRHPKTTPAAHQNLLTVAPNPPTACEHSKFGVLYVLCQLYGMFVLRARYLA